MLIHFLSVSFVSSFLSFFFYCYGDHRDLHSFPTRRSSDLPPRQPHAARGHLPRGAGRRDRGGRSEEHTTELQSRPHIVCRLLLEKKKNTETQPVYANT